MIVSVRRVEKNEVPGGCFSYDAAVHEVTRFCLDHVRFIFRDFAEIEISFDEPAHFSRAINESDVSSASGKSLDADRT
jgi:hypothetical protein